MALSDFEFIAATRNRKPSCPACGDSQTQRIYVVWATGTSLTWSGQSQTLFAAAAAPPVKPHLRWMWPLGVIAGASLVLLGIRALGNAPWISSRITLILLLIGLSALLGGIFNYIRYRERRHDWTNDYEDWEQKWVCLSCGGVFLP